MSDSTQRLQTQQAPRGHAHLNSHKNGQPARKTAKNTTPDDAYQPKTIDPLAAQNGALRHILRSGDTDKLSDLKDNRITPQHFQDPNARTIAEVLWTQSETRIDDGTPEGQPAPIDLASIAKVLSDRAQTDAFAALFADVMPTPDPDPAFRDCLHAVLNWKRAAKSAAPISEFALDEIGNGKRFAAENTAEMRYCTVREKWLIYKNGRWQPDNHGEAERRAKRISLAVAEAAAREVNDDQRSRLLKHAQTLTRRTTRETMLKDATSEDGIPVTPDQFDNDLNVLNMSNGTLDLQTFALQSHNPQRLLSLQSPVAFDPGADCPIWRHCMNRWIADDATRLFLQDAIGVTLSGKVFDEFFIFLYGDGDNGKSTFLRVLEWLMGSYWHKTQAETIMQARDQRQANAPAPEKLALKGARLVTVHEIDRKHILNATLIKDLTGRDAITARGLFEKLETTFEPQFTLWMFGNGKPQIKDTSGGMWRRPRLIDFGQPIPASERDPQLGDKLCAELPGILNWAIEGLRRVYDRGLIVPDAVKAATAEYQAEQDAMSGFIGECCTIGKVYKASAAALWKEWGEWCLANGEPEGSQRAFGLELKRRKFEKTPGRGGVIWEGIGLKVRETQPEPPKNDDSVNLVNLVNDIPVKSLTGSVYARTLSEEGSQGSQGSQNRQKVTL
jgi:putative DNA primase/helicase